jgi:hypothetical protein
MAWRPSYLTTEQLRSYLNIQHTDADDELADAIAAASRAVDRTASRQFGIVDTVEERFYLARWDRRRSRWIVEIDDIATTTGLVVTCSGGTITDYVLEPRNAVARGRVWEALVVNPTSLVMPTDTPDDMAITGLWGWPSVPSPVRTATRLQANRFFSRKDSPYGVAGSPESGGELRLLARVDPDVAVMIGDYRRLWGAR